jgi:glycosyltransferase involved in cell wall biosynthesis
MSMGKPVITSKVDGVPSVIYPEAIDVQLGDALALKQAMENMLNETSRSSHAMHAMRHYSERFRTSDIRLKHLQVLAERFQGKQRLRQQAGRPKRLSRRRKPARKKTKK